MPFIAHQYKQEFDKFVQTDEAKMLRAPYEGLREFMSQQIGQAITFDDMLYLSAGVEVIVRITFQNIHLTNQKFNSISKTNSK